MRKLVFAVLLMGVAGVSVFAQQPTDPLPEGDHASSLSLSLGSVETTPEMWFYAQELRRAEDPKVAVRRKAEFRSIQRQRRIAALKWFGISNSRPVANPTPHQGTYAHGWVANPYSPMSWTGNIRSSGIVIASRKSSYGLW